MPGHKRSHSIMNRPDETPEIAPIPPFDRQPEHPVSPMELDDEEPRSILSTRAERRDDGQQDVDPATNPGSHSNILQNRPVDANLDAALARMFPKPQLYNVKVSHITSGNQWHPTNPPSAQPKTIGAEKKVHKTVLDFLTDIMRNTHWRGFISSPPKTKHKDNPTIWPRTKHPEIEKIILNNPFLYRLALMLESRFASAATGFTDYVPSVAVHGQRHKSAPLEPRFIAGLFIQALGTKNISPCALCMGDWNAPIGNILYEEVSQVRPFKECISLSNLNIAPRFTACGNHFFLGAISDCGCVSLTAPLHPDEREEYFWKDFNSGASNAVDMQNMVRDDWCKISHDVGMDGGKEGWIRIGPFWVRKDLILGQDGRVFRFAAEELAGVATEIVVSRGDPNVEGESWKRRLESLNRL